MQCRYPFLRKPFLGLIFAFSFFTVGLKAQNWSPFRLDNPNYFLLPSSEPIPNTQECISLRFDTILQTTPLPTYRKTWPTYPEAISGYNDLYRPWNYFGTLFIPDSVKKQYKLENKRIQGIGTNDPMFFRPDSLVFSHPRQVGDTAIKVNNLWGNVEAKKDTLIEGQTDSIAIIRLFGQPYGGMRMVLSKNHGLLELPSFSTEDIPQTILRRHFEGPGKRFDFMAGDHPQWAPGDELHFISRKDNSFYGLGNWPLIDKYNESRIIRCQGNGSGGLVFTGTFSSTTFFQNTQQPGTTTTISDSVYSLSNPPSGLGSFPYQADSIGLNESTYGKISNLNPPFPSTVRCIVLPGNLAIKFYDHEILDAVLRPLKAFPPFQGGTFGEGGYIPPPSQIFLHSYPVFYKFGNDSAGVRLTLPTSIQGQVKNGIRIFPNPASQHCFITSETSKVVEVKAIDMRGIQTRLPFDPFKNQLDVRDLAKGLYVLDVVLENQNHRTIRFSKE